MRYMSFVLIGQKHNVYKLIPLDPFLYKKIFPNCEAVNSYNTQVYKSVFLWRKESKPIV